MGIIKNPIMGISNICNSPEERVDISKSETQPNGVQPVGQTHSRNEAPAMGADMKESDFWQFIENSLGHITAIPERAEDILKAFNGQIPMG